MVCDGEWWWVDLVDDIVLVSVYGTSCNGMFEETESIDRWLYR